MRKSQLYASSVLIETYWNVKRLELVAFPLTTSINRNILECKGDQIGEFSHVQPVLIETYWNVKADVPIPMP